MHDLCLPLRVRLLLINMIYSGRIFSRSSVTLSKMEIGKLLSKENLRVLDRTRVSSKLQQIQAGGAKRLQVISDFDHTISRSRTSTGDVGILTHGILANQLNDTEKEHVQSLCDKYLPIEQDHRMTAEEKTPHMVDWWEQTDELIAQHGFDKRTIEKHVADSNAELREHTREFFSTADSMGVPVLVFSAGIGDAIRVILDRDLGKIPPNMHIISNFMNFDSKGVVCGFRPPLIHTFNKNMNVLHDHGALFDQLRTRTNVLLLGDSLGDMSLDAGVVDPRVVLKIGFFNGKESNTALESYLNGYDVVLMDDQTFDVPLALLKLAVESS